MRRSNVSLLPGFLITLLGLFCISALPGYLLAPVSALGNEDTFEFTNDEAEDAYDLHIEWSRAVTVKAVSPFKKTSGSGSNNTVHTKGVVKQGNTAAVTVTWDGTDPSIKKWWWSKLDGSRLGNEKTGNPSTAQIQSREGLYVTTFATGLGKIRINLPDDMAAGDTISGTVIAEPKGPSDDERSRNRASLEGLVIEIGNQKISTKQPSFSWVVPRTGVSPHYLLRLVEVTGGTISAPLPIQSAPSPRPPGTHSGFTIPTIGQAGRPIEIRGPFDGNAANTTVRFGPAGSRIQDFEKNTEKVSGGFGLLRPLAESPRQLIVESPTNVTGAVEIMVQEGGVTTTAPYRNVGVQLNAPKTTLLRGESTTLKVEVSGLEGIKSDVPLHLDTQGVIRMDGGNVQNVTIHPADIQSGGRYTTTRAITGQQTGAFTCTATVVVRRFDVCLQDERNPTRVILWNSLTGDYLFSQSSGSLGGSTSPGNISTKSCVITLEHRTTDRRVQATVDVCHQTGSAMIQVGPNKNTFNITNRNTSDNVCPAAGPQLQAGIGLSREVESRDELLAELSDLRERKKYDCDHGREYQQAFADRIAVIKRVLRSFHGQRILNDPIDENCPPK